MKQMTEIDLATDRDLPTLMAVEREGREVAGREAFIRTAVGEGRCLLARDGGTVTGFVVHDRSLFDQPFVALLRVGQAYRRRGIGTDLMRAVIARTPGDRLFTSTNDSNIPMRQLLGRIGFVSSGYIENLDPDDPELIYIRWLDAAISSPGAAVRDDLG